MGMAGKVRMGLNYCQLPASGVNHNWYRAADCGWIEHILIYIEGGFSYEKVRILCGNDIVNIFPADAGICCIPLYQAGRPGE